jgi:hypothetical protein
VLSFVIICFSIPGHVGAEEGYYVGLSVDKTIVTCGDLIYVFVGINKDFAATEITLTYDSNFVKLIAEKSSLGAAYVDLPSDGLIKIIDFGETKKSSNDNYVFVFTSTKPGKAKFNITKAGFGTKESAATSDLYEAILPSELSVKIKPKNKLVLNKSVSSNTYVTSNLFINYRNFRNINKVRY